MNSFSYLIVIFFILISQSFASNISVNYLEGELIKFYQPSRELSNSLDNSDAFSMNTSASLFPSIAIVETYKWQLYNTSSLDITTVASYSIIDEKRKNLLQISEINQRLSLGAIKNERLSAIFSLRVALQALLAYESVISLLTGFEIDIRRARPHWLPTTPASKFAPVEIDPYLKFLELIDSRKNLELQASKIRNQISKWTKITLEELGPGKIQFPGDVFLPSIDANNCVNESVAVERAILRLEQEKLNDQLQAGVFPIVTVSGSVTGSSSVPAGQSPFSYQVGITANIPIGPTAPVAGNVQVSANAGSNAGLTQSATLAWPNALRSSEPQGAKWAQKNLEDVREGVANELTDLQRSRVSLEDSIRVNKQRLDWGERAYRDSSGTDELVRLNARFALMNLKIRALYDHFNLQANALNLAQLCKLPVSYVPRDAAFTPVSTNSEEPK